MDYLKVSLNDKDNNQRVLHLRLNEDLSVPILDLHFLFDSSKNSFIQGLQVLFDSELPYDLKIVWITDKQLEFVDYIRLSKKVVVEEFNNFLHYFNKYDGWKIKKVSIQKYGERFK